MGVRAAFFSGVSGCWLSVGSSAEKMRQGLRPCGEQARPAMVAPPRDTPEGWRERYRMPVSTIRVTSAQAPSVTVTVWGDPVDMRSGSVTATTT